MNFKNLLLHLQNVLIFYVKYINPILHILFSYFIIMGNFVEATIKEIKNIYKDGSAPSDSTISRRIDLARSALGKKEHQIISLQEYCNYFSIRYSE
ncbi:hypothetical protein TRIP_D300126 [uncultured Paludibacter sp.]|uniref:Uncharacterized protein n=1 Tax=uncultured Paludibacter sp. TaxID=497635 RepID=A0A653AAW7_9BACT|nr:hypothetical protein TRIP_D300126 [uncultured Paludibacter sp.]